MKKYTRATPFDIFRIYREFWGMDKPATRLIKQRIYIGDKSERNRQAVSAFYYKNKDKVSQRITAKRYGLSKEAYEALLKNSNNVCAICKSEAILLVDHDHNNGKVRGMLCRKCNSGLGYFDDKILLLRNAAEYLEKNS